MSADGVNNAPANRMVRTLPNEREVASAAAELFVTRARVAQAERGVFTVALTGGSSPRLYHQMLASSPLRDQVDWSRIQFFWGDERCVPPDDPQSNYLLGCQTLLDHVPVPAAHIHRMRGEDDPASAASAYEAEIRQVFNMSTGTPQFDLILLGMGSNGHCLSLFPHTGALHVTDRLVVANHVAEINMDRLTFTTTLANNAALIAFDITGADKAPALSQVLEGPRNPDEYPTQLIAPVGELLFLVDPTAASQLKRTE